MSVQEILLAERIIAVVVINKEEEIAPTIDSLMEGGIRVLELALRNDYSLEAARIIKDQYPELVVGAGTVLNPEQVPLLIKLGLPFGVAPGLNRRVIEAAQKGGFPFFPGVATPSDVEEALEYGIRLLKFFPAEANGGLAYLKSMNGPYAHLGLKYIPLGGVSQENLETYLREPFVGAIGGSWIASPRLIEEKNWGKIRKQAKAAVAVKHKFLDIG